MTIKKEDTLNLQAMTKKHKCDVRKIIQLWKNDRSDFEISQSLGIDMFKIMQVRQEIGSFYERQRYQRLKKNKQHESLLTNKPR